MICPRFANDFGQAMPPPGLWAQESLSLRAFPLPNSTVLEDRAEAGVGAMGSEGWVPKHSPASGLASLQVAAAFLSLWEQNQQNCPERKRTDINDMHRES